MDKQDTIKYCLYARKSSESDERQAMSIDSQIKEMQSLAEKGGFRVTDVRQESHSAKLSNTRPVFKELLDDIQLGTFNGILTWAPDRLSRNAGDLGRIVDLMDQGRLLKIKTYGQVFTNSPNDKFLLMILCSQAKLENDNKGINVKRGIRAKCEMGWRPGPAPLGYINRSYGGVKDITVDPERAQIIREAFDRAAYQYHSVSMVKEFMDKKSFSTRSGKPITRSMVYLMLKNPFYYGTFEFPVKSGKWYKGAHEPLITKEVFNETQLELQGPEKAKWGSKQIPYKGIFTCYSCGSTVCGEEKWRQLKNGEKRKHIYYHCTRYKNKNCKEPYISQKALEKIFHKHIEAMDEQSIIIPKNLQTTMNEYTSIVSEALFLNTEKLENDIQVGVKDYAKYILREGTIKGKRDFVMSLPLPRRLHNRSLVKHTSPIIRSSN